MREHVVMSVLESIARFAGGRSFGVSVLLCERPVCRPQNGLHRICRSTYTLTRVAQLFRPQSGLFRQSPQLFLSATVGSRDLLLYSSGSKLAAMLNRPPPYFPQNQLSPPDENRYK